MPNGARVNIAIVSDDLRCTLDIRASLDSSEFHCEFYSSVPVFTKQLVHDGADLVILDWTFREVSGLDLLSWIRCHENGLLPVLVLAKENSEAEMARALQFHAVDYLVKPLRYGELRTRVRVAQQRSTSRATHATCIQVGEFFFDFQEPAVYRNQSRIMLVGKEYAVAGYLFRNCGKTVSRTSMARLLWGRDPDAMSRTLDSHVSRVRKKLGLYPHNGVQLTSVYGIGYRLELLCSRP